MLKTAKLVNFNIQLAVYWVRDDAKSQSSPAFMKDLFLLKVLQRGGTILEALVWSVACIKVH